MSKRTYNPGQRRPLVILHDDIKTPPFSAEARVATGFLLLKIQRGDPIGLPDSRPMPRIGSRCHELRIDDGPKAWRVVYRVDGDAVLIVEVFAKKTAQTPETVIRNCQRRLGEYDRNREGWT